MLKPRGACGRSSHSGPLGLKNSLFYILDSCIGHLCDILFPFCTELCQVEKYKNLKSYSAFTSVSTLPCHASVAALASAVFKQLFFFRIIERKRLCP